MKTSERKRLIVDCKDRLFNLYKSSQSRQIDDLDFLMKASGIILDEKYRRFPIVKQIEMFGYADALKDILYPHKRVKM